MKKLITILSAVALLSASAMPASAQINFNVLKNKAANAAKNAAKNAANKAVDKAVDAIENGTTKDSGNNTQNTQSTQNTQVQSVEPQSASFQTVSEPTTSSAAVQDDKYSEAVAKYVSYKDKMEAAIKDWDIDFLLSDTFQKEIPSLVETIKSAPTYDISGKADNWDNYKNNATSILSGISGKAPGPREYIPRLKYYVEHAEASATEQTKAFWLDRAMSNCKFLGGIDIMLKNTAEMRDYWNRVCSMYDSLDAKYKRHDAEYRNETQHPEHIVFLQTGLPDFDTQYAETKAKVEKQNADKARAAAASSTSRPSGASNTSASSNTVKVKELKSTGSNSYDVIGTNNSKIGSIKKVTSSDSYYIYDKSLRVVGEIRKNQGSSGYTIFKNSSRKGETSNFTQAAKWVLE